MTRDDSKGWKQVKNTILRLWWPVTILIVATASGLCFSPTFVGINHNAAEIWVDLLAQYSLLVVAIERAAAVIVNLVFTPEARWSLRINRISEVTRMEDPKIEVLRQVYKRESALVAKLVDSGDLQQEITAVTEDSKKEAYIGYLTSARHAYEFRRARFNEITNRRVTVTVFVGSLAMAALGVSIFESLFTKPPSGLLRCLDIVVTGGFLGGGSASLNNLVTKGSEAASKYKT